MTVGFLDVLHMAFMQRAFLAGSFIAISCASLGLFLVLRQQAMIGDGLSHFAFAAVGFALLLGGAPLWVATPLTVFAAFLIMHLPEKTSIFGDTAVGMISAVGLALGVLFASIGKGFNVDLFSYLFGDILTIGQTEVVLSIVASVCVLLLIVFYYHDLFAVTFDPDHARVQGIHPNRITNITALLIGVIVVMGIKVVGALLVSGLLIFPAITALQVARSFRGALLISTGVSLLGVVGGIWLAFFCDLPAGATIILLNAAFFLLAYIVKKVFR